MLDVAMAIEKNFIWAGVFSKFELAKQFAEKFNSAFNQDIQGFNSSIWQSRQLEMLDIANTGRWPRQTSIYNYLSAKEPTRIIDLGGGSGWLWAGILKTLTPANWEYINVELESTKKQFEKYSNGLRDLTWKTAPPYIFPETEKKTAIYSNSCLQYFENNEVILELIEKTKPDYIILDDLQGQETEEFYTLQNYYGFLQVNRSISLSELTEQLRNLGYEQILRTSYEVEFNGRMQPRIFLEEDLSDSPPESWTLHFVKKNGNSSNSSALLNP